MDLNADLHGICGLMRAHIEIRNRSYMKTIYRDCFLGCDAIDFLVTQGLVDTRQDAIAMCNRMIARKLLRHISDSQSFKDGYSYYIFTEDTLDSALLANCNAGNGNGIHYGKGGCKWSFAPHTAHNSYVLDIALAEEIERAVAGASVEARALAISKLRQRVREQTSVDAPDWNLVQSSEVNGVNICVYNRSRPRGDLQNNKMTGKIAESPRECIRGIMNFERRRQWERMFEDGVVVEPIDIGERYPAPLFDDENIANGDTSGFGGDAEDLLAGIPYAPAPTGHAPKFLNLPENAAPQTSQPALARKTDDVFTFLQTVDLTGIPRDMAIGFLNDPERQHALSHLRRQMLESSPEDCVLCREPFHSSADYRFCPCCASICCGTCMSKRVFEVVSRQVVSVCVHCYRESSRIRQPPEVVKDESHVDQSVRGKWWRPEDLGIPDYSDGLKSPGTPSSTAAAASSTATAVPVEGGEDDPDRLTVDLTRKNISPFVRSLFASNEDMNDQNNEKHIPSSLQNHSEGLDTADEMFDDTIDELEQNFHAAQLLESTEDFNDETRQSTNPSTDDVGGSNATGGGGTTTNADNSSSTEPVRTARCKKCGEVISRNVEEIERHMDECVGLMRERDVGETRPHSRGEKSDGPSKILGGIPRKVELEKYATRIVYHTARTHSKLFRPREVCALQDSFVDRDGVWYSYEISVRHCDVQGIPGYATAEILLLLHAARPIPGNKDFCDITIISQVDSRTKAPKWLLSLTEEGGGLITAPRKMDLVRELKASGNLKDILNKKGPDGADDDAKVSLNDFELMTVLGRGGFGKVMQVRHKSSDKIYAMKILKKSELQRRRQVERTKTERTILAAIQHPFIVCLHYAFQNSQKLYMVMDFVQGGDFFTLMRKYRRLPEDWVRVYVTEVAMALQHLHDMDIVYRDLKPENILLCSDGHLKLTDFGLSRYFETRPPAPEDMVGGEDAVTRSFCGTEQYMSPEMLLQQGHNWRMDWWCLGLLMHEMISARHPFHGPSHYDTLRNMVTKQPVIDARVSSHAATVIRGLLIKNPRARLCCRTGLEELKTLPFFSTVDWNGTYNKTIPVPYIPQLADITDTSLFETTFTREAPIDSVAENPKQKKRKGGGILGIFGFNMQGKSSSKKQDNLGDSPFAGFSFAKEDEDN